MGAKRILFALFLGLGIPWLISRGIEYYYLREDTALQTEPTVTVPEPTRSAEQEATITVLMGEYPLKMELQAYLTGVLLAEVPADFEAEALKAQAVAARTYTLKNKKHDSASACTDPSCCQAYCSPEDYLSAGRTAEDLEKIRQAVQDTDGLVLMYQGALIDATYFSCSGGKTEEALAVWGREVPYLQSVDSPGEENAAHYVDTVQFSTEEFASLLQTELKGKADRWLGEITYTPGGGVDTICIGGSVYTGLQMRHLLGLHSTAFVITAVNDTVTVTTKGFGHRVGLSQYGAEAMAVAGHTFQEILAHYYPGTELTGI